jgi:hypothetical protein
MSAPLFPTELIYTSSIYHLNNPGSKTIDDVILPKERTSDSLFSMRRRRVKEAICI